MGTPQGGIISPMLCNVALNGLEKAIKVDKKRFNTKLEFTSINRKHPDNKVNLIRYADDFVILAPHKTALKLRIQIAQEFLKTRGLELSKEKSKIVTIFQGFDYLGFNLRKHKHNPYKQKAKSISKQIQVKQHGAGYTLITKPSDKKVKMLKTKINTIFKKQQKHQNKDGQFLKLLLELNPIIIGWRNYYAQAYTSI
jgi:RNA-directed DNA polymerase